MRLFVGIALSDQVARELEAVAARLRSRGGRGDGLRWTNLRWTGPDSWHITLQFLGNATPEQFDCLRSRLGAVRSAPVLVELGSLGCFDQAGVFFANVAVTPGLAALAERVVEATSLCGFAAETRPFHPHITLARAKGQGRGTGLRTLANAIRHQPAFTRFTAREFLLYESHLGAGGSRYEVRERFPLQGS
jgi:RNA 2',3'-cyclic 3'-phosphodiesterase